MTSRVLLTGAAGFIGSQLADRLLELGSSVVGVDNFARGTRENLGPACAHPAFELLEIDLAKPESVDVVRAALAGRRVDVIWHMAANSDIPAGVADSDVDLKDTFLTTHYSLKIAKELGIKRFVFASSSAVYGDHKSALHEDSAPLFPISNYGAMKLASEGAISAALEAFLDRVHIFRFPNVVGGRATHGVIYDLIHKLLRDRSSLEVLGDGSQEKPYLHVSDLIDAMIFAEADAQDRLNYFNVAASDGDATTVRYIAERVIARVSPETPIRYTGGSRGWTGDVPKFSYSTSKLRDRGWKPKLGSTSAVDRAVDEIARELVG